MPEKTPAADRHHGGPGSSQQNADKPKPPNAPDPRTGGSTNTPRSQVSGGGGERDEHHTHDPRTKS